jgi:hypothetical protein
MIICERCGWFIPTDCTCRRELDELSVLRLKHVVADRHRQSVARARESGWPVRSALIDPEGIAEGKMHVPSTLQPPDERGNDSTRLGKDGSCPQRCEAEVGATETEGTIRGLAMVTHAPVALLRGGTFGSGGSGCA